MTTATSNALIDRAASATDRAADQAIGAAHRGVAAVRDGSQHLLDRAQQASDSTVSYIREEPVKAMLIAAASGAALMAVVALIARPRERA